MFKQHMFDLFDEFKGNHSRLLSKNAPAKPPSESMIMGVPVMDSTMREKVIQAESKLEKLESHFETLASMAERSERLN